MHFKVCQESIQMERPISNCTINYYYGEIEFDTGGAANITCGQTSEDTLIVNPLPSKVYYTRISENKTQL